jgi:A118 family predicted phage portal protein
MNKTYQKKIVPKLRREIEYGIALGGLVIKPYVIVNNAVAPTADGENTLTLNTKLDKAEIEFDFVYADHFYPLAFNGSGDITEAAFIEQKIDKNITYSRLEHHKYISSTHQVIITNKAFKSTAQTTANEGVDLGQEISLKQVPDWEGIQPQTIINNADRLMFAYFKMPEANTIDMYCPLGVSGFDKAIKLIKDADYQYSRLLWEYEAGEMAIDIDRDALKDTEVRDNEGNIIMVSKMGHMQQRLYRPVVLENGNGSDTYNPFAPALRDASYIQGLNTILMHIEDVTGLSRGTISEVTVSEARTATELRILKQRSYQTNADIQKAIQRCLEDLVYVMNALCSLYDITPEGEYETSFEWDDSILVDVNEELGTRIMLMQNGIMGKEELRMWYMGETEKQAREALLKVQEENRLAVENNLMTQMEFRDSGMDSSLQQSPDNFRGEQ